MEVEDKKRIKKNVTIAAVLVIAVMTIIWTYIGFQSIILGGAAGFLAGLFIGSILAFANTIFLLLLCFTKSGKMILTNWYVVLFEVILMFGSFILIGFLLDLVPSEYKFYHTPTQTGKRIYFDELKILYPFIFLAFIFFVSKNYIVEIVASRLKNHLTLKRDSDSYRERDDSAEQKNK